MDEELKLINPAGSRGLKINAGPVPTAVETLEHLERTLDDLDPVVPVEPLAAAIDAEADRIISEIIAPTVPSGTADVEAIEEVKGLDGPIDEHEQSDAALDADGPAE